MSTYARDSRGRRPTMGPAPVEFEQLESVTLDDGWLLYDDDREEAWIQADVSLDLDDWR